MVVSAKSRVNSGWRTRPSTANETVGDAFMFNMNVLDTQYYIIIVIKAVVTSQNYNIGRFTWLQSLLITVSYQQDFHLQEQRRRMTAFLQAGHVLSNGD